MSEAPSHESNNTGEGKNNDSSAVDVSSMLFERSFSNIYLKS